MRIYKLLRTNLISLIIWAVFFFLWAYGMTNNVYWSVSRQFLTIIFITLGLMVNMLSGVLDLSFAAEIAASTCVGAYLLRLQIPLALVVLAVMAFHLMTGAVKGFLVGKLRVNPIIITLALQVIVSNLIGLFTGDSVVMFSRQDVYASPSFWWFLFLLSILLSIFLSFLFKKTYYGKYIRMLGENPEAVRESGLGYVSIRMIVSMLASLFYGTAAVVLLFVTSSGSSLNGSHYLYPVIAAACLGGISFLNGRGRVLGAWIGTMSLVMFTHIIMMLGIQSSLETILEGFIIMLSLVQCLSSDRITVQENGEKHKQLKITP